MTLGLTGWEMDDVQKEIKDKTCFELLQLFSEKKKSLSAKSGERLQAIEDGSEKAKERLEKELVHLEKEKCVVALKIAEELSKRS
ncbi:TPA: hypothetical protein ACGW65_000953 [Bacillus paranthracis]